VNFFRGREAVAAFESRFKLLADLFLAPLSDSGILTQKPRSFTHSAR
jgi:hypothetical protein